MSYRYRSLLPLVTSALLLFFCCLPANGEDWMGRIVDDAYVCQLSIPGTHDAATGHGFTGFLGMMGGDSYARTQDKSLSEQWESGIRAFDLRPCVDGSVLRINHGSIQTKLTLEDALGILCKLLDEHPTEMAIVLLRHETEGDDNNSEWNSKMQALLARNDVKSHALNFTPALKMSQARGKLLILSRDEYASTPIGGFIRNWSHSSKFADQRSGRIVGRSGQAQCYIQDFYEVTADGAKDVKRQSILTLLQYMVKLKTTSRIWCINHTSGYSLTTSLFGNTISTSDVYRDNAATQNAAVIEFLSEHAGPIGIVMMDYAAVDRSGNYDVKGLALTQALIENNFRIPDGIQTTLSSSEERKPAYLYDLCGRHAQTNMHGKVIVMNGRKVMVK